MKRTIEKLLLAAVMLTAVSCISDETIAPRPDPVGDGDTKVLLRLKTPGGFADPESGSSTRALTYAEENAVHEIDVLVFDGDDQLVAIGRGQELDFDPSTDYAGPAGTETHSGSGTFSVVLPASLTGKTVRLTVMANAAPWFDKFIGTDVEAISDKSYDAVIRKLDTEFPWWKLTLDPEVDEYWPINMWGETRFTVSPTAKPTIELMRAFARADVGLGTPKYTKGNDFPWSWDGLDADKNRIPFELTGITVKWVNSKFRMVPDLDGDGDPVLSPGSQSNWYDLSYTEEDGDITGGRYITQSIYLPETNIKMGDTEPGNPTNHTSRMAIVVAGKYDSNGNNDFSDETETYYRLDFADANEQLVDVWRNHLYRFNIMRVEGPGYADEDEAYRSLPMNMTADVVVIDENASRHIVFDDEYYLAVDPIEFTFDGKGGIGDIDVQTDYPTRGATVSASESSQVDCDWLYTLSPAKPSTIRIGVDPNPSTTDTRTAWVTIKAGRLSIKVKVTQEKKHIPGVRAVQGVIGYIWNPGQPNHLQLTLDGDKSYYGNPAGQPQSVQNQYTVYVAYFKWGSLIGLSSQDHGGTFSAQVDIIAAKGYDNDSGLANAIGGIGDNYWYIPYADNGVWPVAEIDNGHNGKGDACRHYFGEGWRVPTAKENVAFVGRAADAGWSEGDALYTPYMAHWNIGGSHANTALDPGRGSFPLENNAGRNAYDEVLPALGSRHADSGSVYDQGVAGRFWSSTASTGSYAYYLGFNYNNVNPASNDVRALGLAVRCVRNVAPEPKNAGTLAAPGVIGYIHNPGGANHHKLTIRGSVDFAGTPVMENNGAGTNALATGQPLESETVYVAYFKWGSLVATGSEYAAADGTFEPSDIVAAPKDYNGNNNAETALAAIRALAAGPSGTNTGAAAWGSSTNMTIPYRYGTDAQNNKWALDAANGLGDPCAYYSDQLGSGWFVPNDLWYGEYGYPFGTQNSYWSPTGGNGPGSAWIPANNPYGLPLGAVGGKSTTPGDHDWSMFLTATGNRNTSGAVKSRSEGYYWSSSVVSSSNGYMLFIGSTGVDPVYYGAYNTGYSIRCVQAPHTPYTGLVFDKSSSNPANITGAGEGAINEIIAKMRRAMVKKTAEGEVTIAYLDNNNSSFYEDGTTPATLTGGDGDVMVYKPEFWYKYVATPAGANTFGYDIAAEQPADASAWIHSPASLIGAFKSNMSGNKLYSRYGVTPTGGISQANSIVYAQNRGEEYGIIDYEQHSMIALLFYAKYGNRDSQAVLGAGGATNTTQNGSTIGLGNRDTAGATSGHASFAGIEGVHGGMVEWVGGATIVDGVWTITDPESATTRDVTAAKTLGYINEIAASIGPHFDMAPTAVGGSETTYYADYYFYSTGSRVLARSFDSTNTDGGVSCTHAFYDSSYTNTYIASRLAFRGAIKEAASVAAFKALPVNN